MKYLIKLISINILFISFSISAAEHEVKMLNMGTDGTMVFEPAVLKVNKGDTIHFKATDMMHNSESITGMIPAGAENWSGAMSADVSITLNTEGVYVYKCTPHTMMAMVGVIQVGNASNIDTVKAAASTLKNSFVVNKERLTQYLSQL
ncbi:pseudoazurin [SAR86 cluster bacterium]|jgi:pseudoazurin|nr:pseudoazurin [SAR86 cluster bacterium]